VRASCESLAQISIFVNNYYCVVLVSNVVRGNVQQDAARGAAPVGDFRADLVRSGVGKRSNERKTLPSPAARTGLVRNILAS